MFKQYNLISLSIIVTYFNFFCRKKPKVSQKCYCIYGDNMFRKKIILHKRKLLIKLSGKVQYHDILLIKRKITYLTAIYNIEHIIIDLTNTVNYDLFKQELNYANITLVK